MPKLEVRTDKGKAVAGSDDLGPGSNLEPEGSAQQMEGLDEDGSSEGEEDEDEDPEGAFIHPDDLEPEEDYYDGEGEITYPGVIRPWSEALEKMKEEVDSEKVYDDDGYRFPLAVSADSLNHMGFGVSLHFKLLQSLAALFFVMSILATPALVFNYYAQTKYAVFSDKEDQFSQISIGTQMGTFIDSNGAVSADLTYMGYTKDQVILTCSFLDVAYTGIFLAGILGIRMWFTKQIARQQGSKLSLERFSIQVVGLPHEPATVEYAQEIKDHFEALYGEFSVAEVALATNNGAMLDTIEEKAEAVKERRKFASVINRSRGTKGHRKYEQACKQVEELEKDIQSTMEDAEPVTAVVYVTFETVAATEKCLLEYTSPLRFVYCPAELQFRDRHILWVKRAPAPDNIFWQHLSYGKIGRICRQTSTHFVSLFWIIMTFIILTFADVYSGKMPPKMDAKASGRAGTLNCTNSFPMQVLTQYPPTTVQYMLYNKNSNYFRDTVNLIVKSIDFEKSDCGGWIGNGIFLGLMPDDDSAGDWPVVPQNTTYIHDLVRAQLGLSYVWASPPGQPSMPPAPMDVGRSTDDGGWELPYDTSLAVGPNEWQSYQCAALVCYGQYCDKRGLTAWLFDKDGLGQFCQSYWASWQKASSMLIAATFVGFMVEESVEAVATGLAMWEKHWTIDNTANSVIFKVFLATLFNMLGILLITFGNIKGATNGLLDLPFLFGGKHTDFSRDWYGEVGSAFIRTMAAQVFMPFISELLFMAIGNGIVRLKRNSQANQEQLNELYEVDEFEPHPLYGELQATLFVTMALCPGLPIIVWFFFGFVMNALLLERVKLLRLCKKPERPINPAMLLAALRLMPWSVFLHFAFGCWMFAAASSKYVYGGWGFNEVDPTPASLFETNVDEADQFNVRKRIWKTGGLPQFVGFVCICVVLPIYNLYGPVRKSVKSLVLSRKGNAGVDDEILALPTLSECRPAYINHRKEGRESSAWGAGQDPSHDGAKLDAEHSAVSLGSHTNTPRARRSELDWNGGLSYDMTTDERHAETFAHVSATGKLSAFEAQRFTVFSHGGRVKAKKNGGRHSSVGDVMSQGKGGGITPRSVSDQGARSRSPPVVVDRKQKGKGKADNRV